MILVTGAAGQLGSDVVAELNRRKLRCMGVDLVSSPDVDALDITNKEAVFDYIRLKQPKSIIHCAAYTAVDRAEDESELCFRVNVCGTEHLALAAQEIGAEMIYISTDYVFKGDGDEPHETDSPTGACSVYGKSKLAGEEATQRILEKLYIVRISWVFGINGNNFAKTMLKLAETRDELNVVSDQVGSPTYTPDLAVLLSDMALSGKYGVYHATNEGFCSWAEFAELIMKLSGNKCKINHITSAEYPTKAARPQNSRLSKYSLDNAGFARLPDFSDATKRFLIDFSGEVR